MWNAGSCRVKSGNDGPQKSPETMLPGHRPTVIDCREDYSCSRSLPDVRPVCGGRQQPAERLGIRHPQRHHPAVAVGIAVDDGGVAVERTVDFDDLTGHRAVELRDRLDRLYRPEAFTRLELLAG